ncbi:MAG TPA: hypothetical protein VEB41_12220 [Burkholderiales bacterium]|nr:hypothetical protein [Burkholderiales bacterium]
MTRPSEIKPREDSTPGTPYAGFAIGRDLGETRFTITPEIAEEYFRAVDADRALYRIDGRQAAAPNVLFPYMTCALYRTYPPIQGIVMGEVEIEFHHPIWADEDTEVVATGRILDKFERKGRRYVRWEEEFRRADGQLLAKLVNTFHVPE